MTSSEEIQERWDELVDVGVLTWDAMDEDDEAIFVVDQEVLKEYDEALYQKYMNDLDAEIMTMFVNGLVDIEFTEDGINMSLSEKGEAWRVIAEESQQ